MKNPDNQENNTSTAAALIRAQGEQIRENPAEYVARKYGIGGNTVDKGNATELPEQKG